MAHGDDGTTLVDPSGRALGLAWGAPWSVCEAALGPFEPGGLGVRGTSRGARTWATLRWWTVADFDDGALWRITLAPTGGAADLDQPGALARVARALEAVSGAPLARVDEGLFRLEVGATRLTLDLLEGRLTLEESEP